VCNEIFTLSTSTKSYFEMHAHDYSRDPRVYDSLADEIRKIRPSGNKTLILDMGCGKGNFMRAMINRGVRAHYFGTDLSSKMIQDATNNITHKEVEFFVADGTNIPINSKMKFDIIHIDSVLHHLIGRNRKESIKLARRMVENLHFSLSPNGMLIVEEMYYNSYLIPQVTSFLIFYLLKIMNFFNIDISPLIKEMKPGLEVNFFHEKQLSDILSEFGSCYKFSQFSWKMPRYYQSALLESFGYVTFIMNKNIIPMERECIRTVN
jgi:SAM-dependent methyltransferase